MSYEFWRKALKDPTKIGTELPVHENDPQPGFYRMNDRDGGDMIPVAIWRDSNGDLVAKAGTMLTRTVDSIWTFCCRHPIEEQVYRGVIAGGSWPDSPPENPGIGHNMPDDPFEALKEEVFSDVEIGRDLLKKPVTNSDEADKVANFTKRIAALGTKAETMFKVEKQPWLDGGRAVDDKFRDVRDTVKVLVSQLKAHVESFLKEERARERERQRIAAEDAAAKRRAAEEAARKAADVSPNPDDPEMVARQQEAERLAAEAAKAEREATERRVQAGRTGSKVSLRTVKHARIVDYDKLVEALKDRDEMKELVQSLANRAARSGVDLPGMEVITEEKAV